MDVAQISTSAVMPGAVPLSTPSELPVGASAPSPLFREMFAKAALAAETPGTLQMSDEPEVTSGNTW